MPETKYRLDELKSQNLYDINKFYLYPGIKYSNPSWIGCGMSYYTIAKNCLRQNIDRITICEDDVKLPDDFEFKYDIINEFLDTLNDDWDIFVGCITICPDGSNINKIYNYKGYTFIEVNKFFSAVFNIYNKSYLQYLSKWVYDKNNADTQIDRFLMNKKLKVIVMIPYFVRCIKTWSTLWGIYYDYADMFDKAEDDYQNKIIEYKKNITDIDVYKNSFGFIILRHVNSNKTNEYWQESYRCIRKLYPNNKIIIIDDNSNYSFIDNEDFLINCTIIKSEFPKRGELLPYIYFYKNKFFDTAIIIHDSVFIQNYIDFTNYNNVKFLWDFEQKTWDDVAYIKFLISKLNYSDKILEIYDNEDWKGCFGVMSVISYDFLKNIIEKYNMLNLIDCITEHNHRCCLERVFAIICYAENFTNESFFNKINKDIIKVWTGR